MTTPPYARYETLVHASNLNSDYGIPVVVYASSRIEAAKRAVEIGWSGDQRDARVTFRRVDEVDPRLAAEVGITVDATTEEN